MSVLIVSAAPVSFSRIAQTAESAGRALSVHDDASATSKVGQLKASISKVSDMLDKLSVSKSDQSRKRCAVETDAGRNAKALKREPQEDIPLSPPQIDSSIPQQAEQSPTYPSPLSAHPLGTMNQPIVSMLHSRSQPPSRAPSPPEATHSTQPSFNSPKSGGTTGFATFLSSSSPAIEYPPRLASSNGSPVFGVSSSAGTSQWDGSIVSTSRHHHSLSAGAITSPPQALPMTPGSSAAVSNTLDAYSVHTPASIIASATSTISPPIGRMSRSGSITGVPYNSPFSFNYASKETPTWSAMAQQSQNLPPTPQSRSQSQSNWYFGPEHPAPSDSPSAISDASSTMAATVPNTTRSSPTDPDGDDDGHDSDDSDSHHRPYNSKKVCFVAPVRALTKFDSIGFK